MGTASGPRRIGLPSLLLTLALIVGLPAHGGGQHSSRATVGAPHASPRPPVGPITRLPVFPDIAPADSARRSAIPFLVGGALAGALIGGLLAASFRSSFCDEPRPGYTCSTTSPAAAALVGAGVGAFVGMILWVATRPADSPPRAKSR
ncbi:MAG: hypothetical protein ABR499_02660 [Gemmatimonadaceae bacterium]